MAKVEFRGVSKRYPDGTVAVNEFELSLADGEFLILVGPSGCGKSTALRMVAGLEEITEGEILIGDRVVNDLTPKERDIAMVFQNYALYPHMTVAENMGFALKLSKVPKDDIGRRVDEAARILGIQELLDRKPRALSGGQRQRVAMGRAIVRSPQAFLMDEPLSNLDAKLRVQMRAEIAQLQNRLEVTTLYVTHDQVEAMTMGDRVAVLKLGELQQAAAPQELYERPANLFVAGFIGSPSMNVAEAELERTDSGLVAVLGDIRGAVPDAAIDRYPKVPDHLGDGVAVGLRPEHFFRPDGSVPHDQRFKVEVALVESLGSEVLVHFKSSARPVLSDDMRLAMDDEEAFRELERRAEEGQTFTARLDPIDPPKVGEQLELAFKGEHMHFFDRASGRALR